MIAWLIVEDRLAIVGVEIRRLHSLPRPSHSKSRTNAANRATSRWALMFTGTIGTPCSNCRRIVHLWAPRAGKGALATEPAQHHGDQREARKRNHDLQQTSGFPTLVVTSWCTEQRTFTGFELCAATMITSCTCLKQRCKAIRLFPWSIWAQEARHFKYHRHPTHEGRTHGEHRNGIERGNFAAVAQRGPQRSWGVEESLWPVSTSHCSAQARGVISPKAASAPFKHDKSQWSCAGGRSRSAANAFRR